MKAEAKGSKRDRPHQSRRNETRHAIAAFQAAATHTHWDGQKLGKSKMKLMYRRRGAALELGVGVTDTRLMRSSRHVVRLYRSTSCRYVCIIFHHGLARVEVEIRRRRTRSLRSSPPGTNAQIRIALSNQRLDSSRCDALFRNEEMRVKGGGGVGVA